MAGGIFLKGFENADFSSEKKDWLEQIKQAPLGFGKLFPLSSDNDAKEFAKAAYLENVQLILDEIGSLNQESDSQVYQTVLARVVAISKEKTVDLWLMPAVRLIWSPGRCLQRREKDPVC